MNQFKQNVGALTPSQTYTFVRDNKSYIFATHKTTYGDVVKQLGPPTKSGTAPDGANVIMYRAVSDPDTSNRHDYTKYLSYLTISDATFVFGKDSLLLSAKIEDKSNDPVAIKEVRDGERKAQGSAAPRSVKSETAPSPTMDIQTRFEMALIEKNGNYRCSWPLSQKQKNQAEERIKDYGKYINRLDYQAQISRGMSLGQHQTNAEYCLDGPERKKFDAAITYLGN